MKKIISIILIVAIMVIFNSCGKKDAVIDSEVNTDNVAATTENKTGLTYTGLKPLPKIKLEIKEIDNKDFSKNKIEHSYGVAKNGQPHNISVESQRFFESKKFSAVTFDTQTKKNIYLTFDCGYENGYTSKILDVLKKHKIKAAFFCTLDQLKSEPELIARMINEGHIVGNHSTTHPSFDTLDREGIAKELEDCENYLREKFGYSSKYFRFPKGNYSEYSLDTVSQLGFVSVFWSLAYADWDTENRKGADYAFNRVTERLHPGAIILLHSVSADNAEALDRIIRYAVENGYIFENLENINLSYSNYIIN